MDVEHGRYRGHGKAFFLDGRECGDVRYSVNVAFPKITGQFWALDPAREPRVFSDFTPHERGAFLLMEDGRWWKCTLQPNGEATHQGKKVGFSSQPKVE
jgi:hypothetical protein